MASHDPGKGDSNSEGNDSAAVGAVTYATDNSTREASQPRQPRNLQDLLRYSTEVTAAAGRNAEGSASTVAPLDEESKKFLEDALKYMTVDVIGELMKSIKVLQKAGDVSEDSEDSAECEAALDHIFEFVDNLDVANDFHKIGGFAALKPCLNSSRSSIRWRAAELIANLCQNNPYCQAKILELDILSSLLAMIDSDVDDTVRVKALYAVSCMVRDNRDALTEFAKCDGYSVLLRALQSDVEKLNIKSAFLLSALCTQMPDIKDDLVKMGYVEQLVGQIALHMQADGSERHSLTSEHLLSALLNLIQGHEESQTLCRNPELQFRDVMNYIVDNSDGKDQYREENEYAQNLLKIVFKEKECQVVEDR